MTETRHHGTGGPVIPQSRHRPDQRIAIRRKGEGAVDHILDARLTEHREAVEGKFHAVADTVEIVGQQFMAEIKRRAIDCPGICLLLIKTDAEAAPFLPEIAFSFRIHDMGVFAPKLVNFRDILGDQILVFHRMQRQEDADHLSQLPCPETARIDDIFRMDRPFLGDDLPASVGLRVEFEYRVAKVNLGAEFAGAHGIGMGGAGRIKMTVEWIIQPADLAIDIAPDGAP